MTNLHLFETNVVQEIAAMRRLSSDTRQLRHNLSHIIGDQRE